MSQQFTRISEGFRRAQNRLAYPRFGDDGLRIIRNSIACEVAHENANRLRPVVARATYILKDRPVRKDLRSCSAKQKSRCVEVAWFRPRRKLNPIDAALSR
jgi:hypothetical protein